MSVEQLKGYSYRGYWIERIDARCSLDRAFPILITKDQQKLQYCRTWLQAELWVDRQLTELPK